MSNSIFDEALKIIDERRTSAQSAATRRTEELKQKCPEFAETNAKLLGTSCKLIRLVLGEYGENTDEALIKMRDANLKAQDDLKKILIANGYSEDYLDIKYTCPLCEDTGYVDGKRCTCLAEQVKKLSIEKLNSNSSINLYSFDTFELYYYNNQDRNVMSAILNYCIHYAQTFSPDSDSIFMLGDTGLGKTHLSLSIAREVIAKGYSVAYDSIVNYLTAIEKEHFGREDEGGSYATLDTLMSADLVILDDLGSEYKNAFYASTIYNIINTRINKHLPTIISTNLSTEDFQKRYDDRIASRLFGIYTYLEFAGEDIRQIKKIKNY